MRYALYRLLQRRAVEKLEKEPPHASEPARPRARMPPIYKHLASKHLQSGAKLWIGTTAVPVCFRLMRILCAQQQKLPEEHQKSN